MRAVTPASTISGAIIRVEIWRVFLSAGGSGRGRNAGVVRFEAERSAKASCRIVSWADLRQLQRRGRADRGISGRAHAARDRPHLPQAYRVPGCHPTVYSWQLNALYVECSRRLSCVAPPRLSRDIQYLQVEQ